MATLIDHFDDEARNRTWQCSCGWHGTIDEMTSEGFAELVDESCPACGKMLVIIPFPTTAEMRSAAARGNREAIPGLAGLERVDKASKRLTAEEALRALYIDFEGNKDQPPILLGVHRRGRGSRPYVQQDVVDKAFAGLVPRYLPLRDAIANVVARAEHGNRRIVSWSEHDLNVVRTLRAEDPRLVAKFEARHGNARAFAEYWRNKLHGGDKPDKGRLADYLALIDYAVPDDARPGLVGATITAVRPTLERGKPLSASQQARWNRLVEHNRFDCAGMRAICIRATRELSSAAQAS
jgi:hypothetical protein